MSLYVKNEPVEEKLPRPSRRTVRRAIKSEGIHLDLRTKIPAKETDLDSLKTDEKPIRQHLASTSTLKVHPDPLSLKLPRKMLNAVYGAGPQCLLWQTPAEKRTASGKIHRFLMPTFDTNPYMPTAPGEPGLLLCGRTELLDGTWSLFIRFHCSEGQRWNYAGEYSSELVGVLSAQDFGNLPLNVKEKWGHKISHCKRFASYVEMRARMTLRKRGINVTVESVKEELENIAGKPKEANKLTIQDVIDAFESGQEVIPVVRTHCVSYNHEFAEELLSKSKTFKG
ncbi:hypothetical protein NMY22_g13753 [Coprinellus aureogranulatus]|nr:hypothetical protein NMY22_g13753 [Coprinellus aureogranulatus]